MAHFSISSTTRAFGDLPLPQAIRHLAETCFDGVDIPVGKQMEVDAWAFPPGASYSAPDREARLRTVACFNRGIGMAVEMGVRYITLGFGYIHRNAPEWNRAKAIRKVRNPKEHWARHLERRQARHRVTALIQACW